MTDTSTEQAAPLDLPDRAAVEANRARIDRYITRTPLLCLDGPIVHKLFGAGTELYLKLETFQPTGSFKVRGVLSYLLSLDKEALGRGLVTQSAGNHAAAVAYGAACLGTSAKVVMPRATNPRKVALSTGYGAEVVLVDDLRDWQRVVDEIAASEGRTFVPAWGDPLLSLGTASIALELAEQSPPLDAFLVAIGGGSVCSGAGPLIKTLWPGCRVLASEPEGAPTMQRSFASGKVEHLEKSHTIAEGLAPPVSCAYFAAICRACVDKLSPITDRQIVEAMRFLFDEAKLAVEPSGAGALAGAFGPHRDQIAGKRVAIVVSGSNIDFETFGRILRNPNFAAIKGQ